MLQENGYHLLLMLKDLKWVVTDISTITTRFESPMITLLLFDSWKYVL